MTTITILTPDADLSHEDARDWYSSYGWHIDTEDCGSVTHDVVEYDWLDQDDDAVVDLLLEAMGDLTQDEAEGIVAAAREIREAAEGVEAALEAAVEAYQQGDLDGVIAALDEAKRIEAQHGDAPAANALRSQLLEESEEMDEGLTDLDRLHESVRANPSDAALRLVYADALEDAGEDRLARIQRHAAELGIADAFPENDVFQMVQDAGADYGIADSADLYCEVDNTIRNGAWTCRRPGDGVRVQAYLIMTIDERFLVPTCEIKSWETDGYALSPEGPFVICSSRGDLTLARLIEEATR